MIVLYHFITVSATSTKSHGYTAACLDDELRVSTAAARCSLPAARRFSPVSSRNFFGSQLSSCGGPLP